MCIISVVYPVEADKSTENKGAENDQNGKEGEQITKISFLFLQLAAIFHFLYSHLHFTRLDGQVVEFLLVGQLDGSLLSENYNPLCAFSALPLGTSVLTGFHQLILIIVQLLNPVVIKIKIKESRFYSKENC